MDYLDTFNYNLSIEIFDKIISIYEYIEDNYGIDKYEYLIPFFLSHLRWIEGYTLNLQLLKCQPYSINMKDYDTMNYHFKKAIELVDEIDKTKAYDKETKASCTLELNWCNLSYFLPILKQDSCILIMKETIKMCLILSGNDIAMAYNQWMKSFDVLTNANEVICSSINDDEIKKDWFNKYYSIFEIPLTFIIENGILNPVCLIPPHFRYQSDYICNSNPDNNFLENYQTLLYLLYKHLIISTDKEEGTKCYLIVKIKEAYDKLIKKAKSLESNFYILKILEKEKNQIKNGMI